MYIEKVANRNSPPCVLIRESFRDGGKVRKRTLANISHLPDDLVESIDLLLKGGRVFENFDDDFQIVRSLPYANVKAVFSTKGYGAGCDPVSFTVRQRPQTGNRHDRQPHPQSLLQACHRAFAQS